jgi:hypothetical protein
MSAAGKLDDAVRAIVRDELGKPPAKESAHGSLSWVSVASLVVLAIDISAVIWALAEVFAHPLVQLIVKSVPAVVGVAFAAYTEQLQGSVRRLANSIWFRTAVSGGLLLVVFPIVNTYHVPLRFSYPPPDNVYIDGRKVYPKPLSDEIVAVPVDGLHNHDLRLAGHDPQGRPREDVYHLRWVDLLKNLRPFSTHPFEVGLLIPVGVLTPAVTVQRFLVVGKFPELFLRGPEAFEKFRHLEPGRVEVSFKPEGATDDQELNLPPGDYAIQYVGQGCVSSLIPLHVASNSVGQTSLGACNH